jgi:hypothetical protein
MPKKLNALTNFITKNLDTSVWAVWKACPDASLDRFLVVLVALKSTELRNELVDKIHVVNKGEYVCGVIDPEIECMRVILCTVNVDIVHELTTMNFLSIHHYEIYPYTHIVQCYIPNRQFAIRMHETEQTILSIKKDLLDEIEWHTASESSTPSISSSPLSIGCKTWFEKSFKN